MSLKTEEIILRHSKRGMDILREYVPGDFCRSTARRLFSLERKRIILTTGFYVAGYAETDGPPGTYFLARALKKLGFEPLIVTDAPCEGFFDYGDENIAVEYLQKGFSPDEVIKKYAPAALISIERCGENVKGDYANMRSVSIAEHTVEIDRLFDLAAEMGIFTVGVGDGGNEIGMGNLSSVIEERLSLVPCKTKVTDLIIATVSNWGAYALACELSVLEKKNLFADYEEVRDYISFIVGRGSIDGVNKLHVPTVDGFSAEIEKEIVDNLNDYVRGAI